MRGIPRECRGLRLGARVAAYRRPLAKSREGAFSQFLVELERYVAEFGNADVPQNYKTKAGYPLGTRVAAVRSRGQYMKGELKEERRRRLDQLGFVWKKQKGRRRCACCCGDWQRNTMAAVARLSRRRVASDSEMRRPCARRRNRRSELLAKKTGVDASGHAVAEEVLGEGRTSSSLS